MAGSLRRDGKRSHRIEDSLVAEDQVVGVGRLTALGATPQRRKRFLPQHHDGPSNAESEDFLQAASQPRSGFDGVRSVAGIAGLTMHLPDQTCQTARIVKPFHENEHMISRASVAMPHRHNAAT